MIAGAQSDYTRHASRARWLHKSGLFWPIGGSCSLMTNESRHAASGQWWCPISFHFLPDIVLLFPSLSPSKNYDRSSKFAIYKMKFSIHDATIADCPALATISLAAFKDDPLVGYLARDVQPDTMYAYHCQQFQRRLETGSLYGLRVVKVVDDDTGCVIQFFIIGFEYDTWRVSLELFWGAIKLQRFSIGLSR